MHRQPPSHLRRILAAGLVLLASLVLTSPVSAQGGATKPQEFREGVRYFDLGHYQKTRELMREARALDPVNDGQPVIYADLLHQTAYVPSYFEGAAIVYLTPGSPQACDEAEPLWSEITPEVLAGAPEASKTQILDSISALRHQCDLDRADEMRPAKRTGPEAPADRLAAATRPDRPAGGTASGGRSVGF